MKRINPYRLFIGAFIPNWLLVQPEVSAMAKITYARLAQFAGKQGYAYPKQPTLAKSLGCPLRNLQRYLEELERHKLIETLQRGLRKPNVYYFLWHPWMDAGDELDDDEIEALGMKEPEDPTLATVTPKMAEPDMPKMAYPDTPKMAGPIRRESLEENHKNKETLLSDSVQSDDEQMATPTVPWIIEHWNLMAQQLGLPLKTPRGAKNKNLQKKIELRLKENPDQSFWEKVFENFEKSSFLKGERGWRPILDWLVDNDCNCIKVFEDAYTNGSNARNEKKPLELQL